MKHDTDAIRLDTAHCYHEQAGIGVTQAQLAAVGEALVDAHSQLVAGSSDGLAAEYASLNLATAMVPELPEIKTMAKAIQHFPQVLVIGIGGSSLGSKAVRHALKPDKSVPPPRDQTPRHLKFIENIDPYHLHEMLAQLEPADTAIIAISKSGGTVETVVQFMILRQWLNQALGEQQARRQQWLVTDPAQGWMRELAQREGLPALSVPPQVGGRYSVLSSVGLLPLAVCGLDIETLLAGAEANAQHCQGPDPAHNPALEAAALYYLLDTQQHKRISIMMPYVNRLRLFVDWYCQLWAESLGKPNPHSATAEPAGTLPVRAMGAVDQHSQLQMYLESRRDKMFTFIQLQHWEHDWDIPLQDADSIYFPYLKDKRLTDIIAAEFLATRDVITQAGHPNMTIVMPALSTHVLGQLIDFYQRVTIYTGLLYGINPLDQPAVEQGKILARERLSKQ